MTHSLHPLFTDDEMTTILRAFLNGNPNATQNDLAHWLGHCEWVRTNHANLELVLKRKVIPIHTHNRDEGCDYQYELWRET